MVNLDAGYWVFRLRCPGAKYVSLCGGFNGWSTTADPMIEVADGVWQIACKLESGVHRFRYWTSNRGWVVDQVAHGQEPNADGGWDFIVHVDFTDTLIDDDVDDVGCDAIPCDREVDDHRLGMGWGDPWDC